MNTRKHTYTTRTHSIKDRLAAGYESDGSEEPRYDIGWWGPAGQMYSTTSDLNKVSYSPHIIVVRSSDSLFL